MTWADLFDFATLTLESIPNPSRSIDALSVSVEGELSGAVSDSPAATS
jgi:hypothetical protein